MKNKNVVKREKYEKVGVVQWALCFMTRSAKA